jgi:hypothetical protein
VNTAYAEWFGAVGDGKQDDHLPIQKAIDSFVSVTLLHKTYKIATSNNEHVGIEVPKHHVLQSNADYLMADNAFCHLLVSDKTINKIILLNNGSCLYGVTIKSSAASGSQTGVATKGFTSMIRLKDVCVGNTNTCYDLQTYLSIVEGCVAQYCGVGFYIHGAKNRDVETTTMSMRNCYVVDSKKEAYKLEYITYSSFECLAADGCGMPYSPLNSSNTYYVYDLYRVKNSSFTSIGAERAMKFINIQASESVIFNTPLALIGYNIKEQESNYIPQNIIAIKYCVNIDVNHPRVMSLTRPGTKKNVIDVSKPGSYIYFEGQSTPRTVATFRGLSEKLGDNICNTSNMKFAGFYKSDNVVINK